MVTTIVAVNSDRGPAPKRRKVTPQRSAATFFKARTSPRSIYKLIQVLSNEQKQAVRDIGLGSILDLGISQCPVHISRYLLLNLDVQNRCIILENGDNIILEEEDVQTVLNIPRGPVEILESLGNNKADTTYNEFLRVWRARWGIQSTTGGPSTGDIYKQLSESQAGDENFKVDFTVLFVSLFLWGTKNQTCRYKILKSLMDVENIKNLNWCAFTLKALASSAEAWKSNQKSHFDGPMTFLLLTYLDRCEYRARKPLERRFPVISCWDDKKVDDRVRWEEFGGGYGMGRAVSRAHIDQVEQPQSHQPPRHHGVPVCRAGIDTGRAQPDKPDNHQMLRGRMRTLLNNLGATLLEVSSVLDEMQVVAIQPSNSYIVRIGSHLKELKAIQSKITLLTYDGVRTLNATINKSNLSPTSVHGGDTNCKEDTRSSIPCHALAISAALDHVIVDRLEVIDRTAEDVAVESCQSPMDVALETANHVSTPIEHEAIQSPLQITTLSETVERICNEIRDDGEDIQDGDFQAQRKVGKRPLAFRLPYLAKELHGITKFSPKDRLLADLVLCEKLLKSDMLFQADENRKTFWATLSKARGCTRIGWDDAEKIILASPKWWQANQAQRVLQQLKDKAIPDFDLFKILFAGQRAVASHCSSPYELISLTSDEKSGDSDNLEDNHFFYPQLQLGSHGEGSMSTSSDHKRMSDTSANPHGKKKKMNRNNDESLSPFSIKVTHTLNVLLDVKERRRHMMLDSELTRQPSAMGAHIPERSPSGTINSPSNMDKCMHILTHVLKLPARSYLFLNGIDLFVDSSDLQSAFLGINNPDDQLFWLQRKVRSKFPDNTGGTTPQVRYDLNHSPRSCDF